MSSLRDLHLYNMVVKLNSISKAANSLNMSRTTASKKIQILEDEFGGALIDRASNSIEITGFGMEFNKFAQEVLKKSHQIKSKRESIFSICTTHSFSVNLIPRPIEIFLKNNPSLTLKIISSDDFSDAPLETIDVFIGPTNIPFKNLEKREVPSNWELGLYAYQSYLEKYGEPESLSDLNDHQLIVFNEDETAPLGMGTWPLYVGRKDEESWRSPKIIANSLGAMIELCQMGLGIIGVTHPERLKKDYGLKRILPEISGKNVSTFLFYEKNSPKKELINQFREAYISVWK